MAAIPKIGRLTIRLTLLVFLLAMIASGDALSEALRARRYGEALGEADALLKTRPRDARLWTARGLALQGLGRDGESLASFERALSLSPNFIPALRGAAESAYRSRDQRAAGLLERLMHFEPENPTAHAMAGVIAFERGDCGSAIRHFEVSGREIRGNPQAYAIYGECLLAVDRAADALPVLESAAAANPDARVLQSLACAQLAAGRDHAALATIRKAIASAPDSEQNYVDLASAFLARNIGQAAAVVVDTGLQRLPASARLYALRGVIEAEGGLDDAAARDFEKSNELDPANQYGAPGLGVLYTDSDRPHEASAILRQRLARDPDDAVLNYLLAQALVREGAAPGSTAFSEVKQALSRAIRVKPDYGAAHAALGKLYVRANDNTSAISEFRSAVELNPRDRIALSQLAAALRRAGRLDEALAVSRRLRELIAGATGGGAVH
jgi:Flp pilus assembly protein TadD